MTSGISFRELNYPIKTEQLCIDGLEIALCERGQGARTLLLLHGLGSYLPVWWRNLDALSQRFRVVAIDLPGYGKSSKKGLPYSMEFFAGVVDRVIDVLDLRRVTLVGHSMGGQIALTHALLRPRKAEALVLIAPAGFEQFSDAERRWLLAVTTTEAIRAAPEAVVRSNLMSCFHEMPEEARFMVEDRLNVISGPDFDDFAQALSGSVRAMLDGSVFGRLPEIAVPALVLFGTRDRLIPHPILHPGLTTQALAELGARQLQRAQLLMIPQAGHMVQFEQPRPVNQAISEFLKENPCVSLQASSSSSPGCSAPDAQAQAPSALT